MSFSNTEVAFRSKTDFELRRAYVLFKSIERPWLVKVGSRLAGAAMRWHLPVDFLIEQTMYRQFCGGETIQQCAETIQQLGKYHIGTILDYSVEAQQKEESFDATCAEILRTVALASKNPHVPFCVFKMTGLARFTLLAKLQAKDPLTIPEQGEWRRAQGRFEKICLEAHRQNVRIFVDAEETWIQDVIDRETRRMMERLNKERAIIFHTIQMYRHDRLAFLKSELEEAKRGGYFLGMKIVRGAYMEKERAHAKTAGRPSPIQPDKAATDRDYDEALKFSLKNIDRIAICAGTHNEASTQLLTQLMKEHQLKHNDPRVFFAQLLGMSDHISYNLADAGYNVAKYVPYGPVDATFPYLVRRAEENTSVRGQMGRELGLITAELKRRSKKSV